MPSKNMIPKGQRHHSVRAEYRATRGLEEPAPTPIPLLEFDDDVAYPESESESDLDLDPEANHPAAHPEASHPAAHPEASHPAAATEKIRRFTADPAAAGLRLDQYLAQAIPDISRARVQLLIASGQVRVNGLPAKPRTRLLGGEPIEIEGEPRPEPLHAFPENIPLDILFEDDHLAVINKPAGMMVHAGSGASEDERNHGTLVNALLFHFNHLSHVSGDLRPGIVHRLDKQTSGIILVAKNDSTHRKLGEMFSARRIAKTYLALVHGHLPKNDVTVNLPIARDLVRRIRMTTRRQLGPQAGRAAISHVHVLERLASPYGPFTLVEVRIETGRTHQIRVHLQSLGHPVVGDFLYGAPHLLHPTANHPTAIHPPAIRTATDPTPPTLELPRNFLHAARLAFAHPQTGAPMDLAAPLPPELQTFLETLRPPPAG